MAVYVYRARDSGGEVVRGRADAESERDLIARLRNQGFLVLEVQRDRDLQAVMQQRGSLFNLKPSGRDLAIFCRQFATMIGAGLPVVTVLKVLGRQTTNVRLHKALGQVAAEVEAGEGLSIAFSRQTDTFPMVMVQMIAAGEVGGILDDVLDRLANQMEKEEQVRQKVRSALIYPITVTCVAIGVVIFLVTFVVPKFVEVYADLGSELPALTQLLIAASSFMRRFWWALLGSLIAAVIGFRYWVRTEQGALRWDQFLLKVPVFGPMLAKQAVGRFSRTLGGLLSSGVTILKALAVVEKVVGNRVIGAAVRGALEEVRQGQTLVVPLRRSKAFPSMVLEMITVGEETGTLEQMLGKVADFFEDEVQRTAERLSASLEPAIIVGLAVTVGFIVAAMMMPIFDLWAAF